MTKQQNSNWYATIPVVYFPKMTPTHSLTSPAVFPPDVGGYSIVQTLPGNSSVLAKIGHRLVVLKPLDPDCLLRTKSQNKLHPNIHDRLSRVRELPHGHVANFYGVERDQGYIYLIWEYLPGKTLAEWIVNPEISEDQIVITLRELIANVQQLHQRGIIHGAIHARNIIIDTDNHLRVTHINPLLYTEREQDIAALLELLRELALHRADTSDALEYIASEVAENKQSLEGATARVSQLLEPHVDDSAERLDKSLDQNRRNRSRMIGAVLIVVALMLSLSIRYLVNRMVPGKISPPQASPEAMR